MKLLIVTQRVDRRDPILGFFHRWIMEFAGQCEQVIAIGQAKGSFDLPGNVIVVSLGKEEGAALPVQILRFWRLLWRYRHEYDAVFVHMTPVWVVLGWPLFFVLRKPVYLWYEVRRGGAMLRAAVLLSRKVLSATKSGLPFHSRKNVVMGHGIDTEIFSPMAGQRDVYLLCAVGRITRIKRVDLFLRCLASLPVPYRLFIAGGTITDDDRTYLRELQVLIEREHLQDRVEIHFVLHEELPALLRSTQLFLHAGGGGLDKALLEAMACGCLVVAASEAAVALLPEPCRATPETFVARTREMLQLSPEAQRVLREQLRGNVVASHSLSSLICRMVGEIES